MIPIYPPNFVYGGINTVNNLYYEAYNLLHDSCFVRSIILKHEYLAEEYEEVCAWVDLRIHEYISV